MTIDLETQEYEQLPFITVEVVKKNPVMTVIEPAPHLVEIKSGYSQGQKKLVISLATLKGTKYVWFANNKSALHLVEKLGKDEDKWVGKKLDLEVKNQVIQGEEREVIYAKGALKKKESK